MKTLYKNINHNIKMLNKQIIKEIEADIKEINFDTTKKQNYINKLIPLLNKLLINYDNYLTSYNFQKNQIISDYNIGVLTNYFTKQRLIRNIVKLEKTTNLKKIHIERLMLNLLSRDINICISDIKG